MKNAIYRIAGVLLLILSMRNEQQAQGLRLTQGAHLVLSGAPDVVVQDGGLINDGELTADSSTFLLTGDMPFIGGARPTTLYNLVIDANTQLNNHLFVRGGIFMQKGNLQLNRYTLDLGVSGRIVDERSDAAIGGGLIRARVFLDAPREVNAGNMGLALSSEGRMGWTTIARGNEQQTDAAIQRYFSVNPERNTGAPVYYRLFYLEGELAGKSRNRLAVLGRGATPGGWTSWGKDQADPNAGWVMKKNAGGAQLITLGIPAGSAGAVVISPNPSVGSFKITLSCYQEEDKVISLYDMRGHLVASRRVHCVAGINTIGWDGARYASGSYRLVAEGADPVSVEIMR